MTQLTVTNTLNSDMRQCIEMCWSCRTLCQKNLYHHCIKLGGPHAEQEHVRIMCDCIDICQAAADFMVRGSDMHESVCASCAEICDSCAISCERIGGVEMIECARLCRECAELCDEMSSSEE